ncbi:hypothetical protein EV715DRAFT_191543 [Schizophyllum commune]
MASTFSAGLSSPASPPPPAHTPPPTSPLRATYQPQPQPPQPLPPPEKAHAAVIDPVLSLELRLRWLEAILLGVKQNTRRNDLKHNETLVRAADDIQRRLNTIVEGNEGLKKFVQNYDQHAHLLTPAFALSGVLSDQPPAYESMSGAELEALLAEMEPDIRAADRDMREIEMLEGKGVTGAGKLGDYEALKPRLQALLKAHEEDAARASSLERRVANLMERHATNVDALSELFVIWDDALSNAEHKTSLLEREHTERQRLGLE